MRWQRSIASWLMLEMSKDFVICGKLLFDWKPPRFKSRVFIQRRLSQLGAAFLLFVCRSFVLLISPLPVSALLALCGSSCLAIQTGYSVVNVLSSMYIY